MNSKINDKSKIRIIPTNFALTKKAFATKLEKLNFAETIHIDYMDGVFTKKKSVSIEDISIIKKYNKTKFEIHLMAYNPIRYLEFIKDYSINKVLIQIEVFLNELDLIDTIKTFKKNQIKVFVVLNPKTNLNLLKSIIKEIDGVMLMSVVPGKEGQEFIEETYQRIKNLRKLKKRLTIQIDGGINDKNIQKIVESGANILSIGSFISSNPNPQRQYNLLVKKLS